MTAAAAREQPGNMPSQHLLVRRYESRDRDAVWALHHRALNAAGAHAGSGEWDGDLHHIEQQYLAAGGEFLVGEIDGRIVAMGALLRVSPDRAEIKRMRVDPGHQRRGFGRTILEHLIGRARELGYTTLHLETTTRQTAARALYAAFAFTEVARSRHGPFEVLRLERDA